MKVYVVRKYLKRTRWDCNHSTKFDLKRLNFRQKKRRWPIVIVRKSESLTCTKENFRARFGLKRRSACELRQDMAIL